MTPENFAATQAVNFSVLGLRSRHRKKAERMVPGDRVLYYVLDERVFPAAAIITSPYFEDRQPIWTNWERKDDPFPYRVHTQPSLILQPWEWLDASALAPRMQYLKRWPPEQWFLAFQGEIHLLSAQDFQLVEREMQRVLDQRPNRRERPPRRPPPPLESANGQASVAQTSARPRHPRRR